MANGENIWPSPKQMTAWLGVGALIGCVLLWAGGLLFVSRSRYENDQRNLVEFQTETKGDVKYIKSGVDDLKRQMERPR